jgi:hypothetical protein
MRLWTNFDAELGGIVALLPVVDVRPDEMAAVKVAKTSILDQVLKALAGEGLKVISEDDALKSMTRVGVLHVVVGATVDEKSQQAAVKVEVEIRRRALVDCCKYVPLVLVWRSGELGLYPVKTANHRIHKAIGDQLKIFFSTLRSVPKEAPSTCDNCRQLDERNQ